MAPDSPAGAPTQPQGLPGRCGAHSRQTGQPCKAWPLRGHTRCKLHGGRSLAGEKHGQFKHGLRTRPMPEDVAARERKLRRNPDKAIQDSLLRKVAITDSIVDRFVQANPEGPKDDAALEALTKTLTTAKGLYGAHAQIAESLKTEQPAAVPVFTINTGDSWNHVPFQERGADGSIALFLDLDHDGQKRTFQLLEVQPVTDGDGVTRLVPVNALPANGEP